VVTGPFGVRRQREADVLSGLEATPLWPLGNRAGSIVHRGKRRRLEALIKRRPLVAAALQKALFPRRQSLVLCRRDIPLLRKAVLIESLSEDDLDDSLATYVETVGQFVKLP